MDLETSMVAAAVTTKEGASATDRVMVIMNGYERISSLSLRLLDREGDARD